MHQRKKHNSKTHLSEAYIIYQGLGFKLKFKKHISRPISAIQLKEPEKQKNDADQSLHHGQKNKGRCFVT